MMHKTWSSIEEVPYCFSRSSVKFQGHIALKIIEFDSNWAFPDYNSSLNTPMAMKCCTKVETAKKRCPIVFLCHPSNFKVTRDKTSPILTQIGRFRTIGRSQLSNPSDLPCLFVYWKQDPTVADLLKTLFQMIAAIFVYREYKIGARTILRWAAYNWPCRIDILYVWLWANYFMDGWMACFKKFWRFIFGLFW